MKQNVVHTHLVAILPTVHAPTSFVDEWPPHVRRLVAAITHVACSLYFVSSFTQFYVVLCPAHRLRFSVATTTSHRPFSCFEQPLATWSPHILLFSFC